MVRAMSHGVLFARLGFTVSLSLLLAACGGAQNEGAGGGGTPKIDACTIVTQDDASSLFGVPATQDTGVPVPDANMISECLWGWQNADNDSRLLQFRVWDGLQYYSVPTDSQPLAIGDQGFVRTHPVAGVDVGWTQKSLSVQLAYSTVGASVPEATTQVEAVKALAQKAAAALP